MNPLSLALSIEWDDCTVAVSGEQVPDIDLSARQTAGATNGPQASRDALTLVRMALRQAGQPLSAVEHFHFNAGPGAFTSLRMAAGLMQGLALPGQRPVGAIGSLVALTATIPGWQAAAANMCTTCSTSRPPATTQDAGQGAGQSSANPWLVCTAIDARMGECYFAACLCQPGHWPHIMLLPPSVGTADKAAQAFTDVIRQQSAIGPDRLHLAGGAFGEGFAALQAFAHIHGQDAAAAAGRRPGAREVLDVARSIGAPAPGPARMAMPHYVRDQVALDRDAQREAAARREAARQAGSSPRP